MIENNPKYKSQYNVKIKPVKSQVTDIEDKKNPALRVEKTVHTMSLSMFNKPDVSVAGLPPYIFDHKRDVGSIGKDMTAQQILERLI
jgi:hypothetical protein